MADGIVESRERAKAFLYTAIVASVLFGILTAMVHAHATDALDHDFILRLRAVASPLLTNVMLAVTFASGRLAIPALLAFAFVLYKRAGTRVAVYYIGTCIIAQALNAILKFVVHRARPHGVSPRLTAAGGLSYPSADAMLAVVIFGLGTLLLTRTLRASAGRKVALISVAIFIVLAAVARVYLGAHWPSDVVGGALAGIGCAAFAVAALGQLPDVEITTSP